MNKSIIVLGMHRSGTSLVSHVLQELGVYMGSNFLTPDEGNKDGYWEDAEWLGINKHVIARAGGTWENPPEPNKIREQVVKESGIINKAIERRKSYGLWGFKDPRTCLTAEFLHPFLPDPHYIMVRRDIDEVAASMKKLRGPGKWAALAYKYQKRTDSFLSTIGPRRAIVVHYNDLVTSGQARNSIYWIAGWLQIKNIDIPKVVGIIKFRR